MGSECRMLLSTSLALLTRLESINLRSPPEWLLMALDVCLVQLWPRPQQARDIPASLPP